MLGAAFFFAPGFLGAAPRRVVFLAAVFLAAAFLAAVFLAVALLRRAGVFLRAAFRAPERRAALFFRAVRPVDFLARFARAGAFLRVTFRAFRRAVFRALVFRLGAFAFFLAAMRPPVRRPGRMSGMLAARTGRVYAPDGRGCYALAPWRSPDECS